MRCEIYVYFIFLIGSISASIKSRIIGGNDADIKQFPYVASLRHKDRHVCGGCIISDRHILTAGHCIDKNFVKPFSDVSVSTGTSSSKDTGNSHRIAKVTVHPEWVDSIHTSFLNDVAVVTLADKIQFDENQQKAELARANPVSGTDAVLAGWGSVSNLKKRKLSDQLQTLKMTILDNADCKMQHSSEIYEKQLCAYNVKGRGSCNGDSGAPVVDDINQLVGVVSWVHDGDCASGVPEVYTNVYAYRDFIESAMRK